MDFRKLSEKNNITKILVKGVDTTLINSIRRSVMNNVPTFAIENISIYDNNSVVFDEYLGHRIGLIPIKSDAKRYNEGDKVKFILEKEGPGTVYSRDIKSTDPKIEVVEKNIPIAKLKKDQKIKLEAEAVVGVGKEHSKWQPALISYKEIPKVNFNMKLIGDAKKFVSECPKEVLELKAGKIIVTDPINVNIDMLMKCVDIAPPSAMIVEHYSDSYVITVENFGNHKIEDIFLLAIQGIKEKIKNFGTELKKA